MVGLLFLAFLVVPFLELFVILKVGSELGALNTIVLLVLVSVVGAWLVKREGVAVVRRAQARIQAGGVPAKELIDGVLILFAGALLLTPGFLTDMVGILLLMPPVRAGLRASTTNALRRRAGRRGAGSGHYR